MAGEITFAETTVTCPGCGRVTVSRCRGGVPPPDQRCQRCFDLNEATALISQMRSALREIRGSGCCACTIIATAALIGTEAQHKGDPR